MLPTHQAIYQRAHQAQHRLLRHALERTPRRGDHGVYAVAEIGQRHGEGDLLGLERVVPSAAQPLPGGSRTGRSVSGLRPCVLDGHLDACRQVGTGEVLFDAADALGGHAVQP